MTVETFPWGDRIPGGWGAKRLRFISTLGPSKKAARGLPPETLVSFVPMEAVGEWGGLRLDEDRPLGEVSAGYTYFAEGDVVVAKVTPCFENGKGALATGLTGGIAFGTTELHVLRAGPLLDRRFLFYLTETHPFRTIGASEMYGAGGQKRVPEWFFRDFVAPLPPPGVQRAIADFLDRKTAAIDAVIEKRRQQLELLEQKHQAEVARLLTRGLRQGSPLMDSGITWMGSIPGHWQVVRLRNVATRVVVGIAEAATHAYVESGGVPLVRSVNLQPNHLNCSDLLQVASWFAQRNRSKTVCAGDILTQRTGEFSGASAVVPLELDGSQCFTMLITTPSADLSAHFASYYINSAVGSEYFNLARWGTAQPNISVPILKDLPLPLPPRAEQDGIVDLVRVATAERANWTTALQSQVAELVELRQAVVTAAVTGQLDVTAQRAEVA